MDSPRSLGKGGGRPLGSFQGGRPEAARLLGRFPKNLTPAIRALGGSLQESLGSAFGRERNDDVHAELGGLFQSPFETIEFDDGQQEDNLRRGGWARKGLEQGEIDIAGGDALDSREENRITVAQFIELARLSM